MLSAIAPIAALLMSGALLFMGNGLQGTLLPVRANFEHFSDLMLGLMGSAYFGGFMLGCLGAPFIIRRVGHIRAFAALVAMASAAPLAHIMAFDPIAWCVLRAVSGFCIAGLYSIVESWLNERATPQNRGSIMSVYVVVNLTSMLGGQMLLNLYDPRSFTAFALVSVAMSLAALPVTLSTSTQPAPISKVRLRVGRLYQISPVGLVGCFAVGMCNGVFWSLGPAFAQKAGLNVAGVSYFMSCAILGGALAQWPIGWLSDRMDRRYVIVSVAIGAGLASFALACLSERPAVDVPGEARDVLVLSQSAYFALFAAAAAFGAFAMTLYALCVAHANDLVDREDYSETATGLLLAYGVGAFVFPGIASALAEYFGQAATFGSLIVIYGLLVAFTLYRMIRRRGAPPAEQRAEFMPTTRTSPVLNTWDMAEDDGARANADADAAGAAGAAMAEPAAAAAEKR